MAQRNYPCDSIIFQYFGGSKADLDVVGEMSFKKQLYQCLIGQALVLNGYIQQHRSTNTYGLQIWVSNTHTHTSVRRIEASSLLPVAHSHYSFLCSCRCLAIE